MSNGAFTPTHTAPPGGMQTWSKPDPSSAPDNQLGGGLPVQLLEETVGWGHVRCSNGWECWVDARLLVRLGAPAPQPVAPAAAPPYEPAPAPASAPETVPVPPTTPATASVEPVSAPVPTPEEVIPAPAPVAAAPVPAPAPAPVEPAPPS